MAINDYASLKTAVANWLSRSDLTARIPEFIALTESSMAYGIRDMGGNYLVEPLRVRAMETSSALTINAQTVALSTGYLAGKRLYLDVDPHLALEYIPPTDFWNRYDSNITGKPVFYTIEGENFVFQPAPDVSYTGRFLYYAKPTAFSADADTNTILTNQPGAYLFGALYEAFSYVQDIEAAQGYLQRYAGIINGLNASDSADRHSGSKLQMRSTVSV